MLIFACGRNIENSVSDVALQTHEATFLFMLMGRRETGSRVPRHMDQGTPIDMSRLFGHLSGRLAVLQGSRPDSSEDHGNFR